MDPFSSAVGTLQIVGQCAQCTVALAKYINSVVNVDKRITSFYEDVSTLQSTYAALEQSFEAPQMIAAMKKADGYTKNLWSIITMTLKDCENTLVAINLILYKISKPPGLSAHFRSLLERPLKQLQEQLQSGELARHHEKIRMFNVSMTLPMHVINITMQLDQRDLSERHQQKLDEGLRKVQESLGSLRNSIDRGKRLEVLHSRVSASSSATAFSTLDSEKAVYEHMEAFAVKATQFYSRATSEASTRSGTSTNLDMVMGSKGGSLLGMPLSRKQRSQIQEWVPELLPEHPKPTQNESDLSRSASAEDIDDDASDETDIELELVRTFFEHGQSDLEKKDYAQAEENFIETLKIFQKIDFGDQLAFQQADVILLLAHCHVEQEKFANAIELLLPLTKGTTAEDAESSSSGGASVDPLSHHLRPRLDIGRILAAHHALGAVYVRKKEFQHAEDHSLRAFKGRRKHFDKNHDKTLESAQLVVDMYTAKGERAKARAYEKFLNPDTERVEGHRHRSSGHSQQVVANIDASVVPQPLFTSTNTMPREQSQPHLGNFNTQPTAANTVTSPRETTELNRPDTNTTTPVQSPIFHSRYEEASSRSSMTASSAANTKSAAAKHLLRPKFYAVKGAAASSKSRACSAAEHILKQYDPDPSRILVQRWPDIKKNIKNNGAEKGLAATGSGYAPIHFFCDLKIEAITEVELLIEEGVDLMAVRYTAGYGKEDPMTPLQQAIANNHLNLAALMIESFRSSMVPVEKLDKLKDPDNCSPLLAACRRGQTATVARLLDYGATVSSMFPQTWCGNSLLHDACSRCDTDMVQLLLEFEGPGVSRNLRRHDIGTVDQQDQFGRTPLMYAVISKNILNPSQRERKLRGRLQTVELLLQNAEENLSRDLHIEDSQKKSILQYAEEEADQELNYLLGRYTRRCKAAEMSAD